MRAVVDIGSNSVKFLLGEVLRGAPKIQAYASRVTRLAEKLDENQGQLSAAALERTARALEEFATQIKGYPVDAVATAAARRAKNPEALKEIVKNKLGCELRIISGTEEAELSRRGARIAAKAAMPNSENFAFIDMGGASTEISFSDLQAPKHSFPCGAVTFMEKMGLQRMPVNDERWSAAKSAVSDFFQTEDFAPLKKYARAKPDLQLIAVGGTLVIAAKIARENKKSESPYGVSVKKAELAGLNEKVRRLSQKERLELPGMEVGREDILCAGLLAIDYLISNFGRDEIFITGWGLRHGLLFGTP